MANRQYDIILYGATGFTGHYAALEMVRTSSNKKLAIAGRNTNKLQNTLTFIERELGSEFRKSEMGVIIADTDDEESIMEMCVQGRVVVNCVGPYRWYGEQVVRCCIEAGTHYVDVAGEFEFQLKCRQKYGEAAVEKHVRVVNACGFDSVPADVGVHLLSQQFPGKMTEVESYIHWTGMEGGLNMGTYLVVVDTLANLNEYRRLQQVDRESTLVEYVGEKLTSRWYGRYSRSERKWCVPFQGVDANVVRWTQHHDACKHERTPVQYATYITFPSLFFFILTTLIFLNIFLWSRFAAGVKMLQRFPKLFTFGLFSQRTFLKREEIEDDRFWFVFHGKGYSRGGDTTGAPDQRMSLKLTGPNPGYVFTSASLIAAAHTLLDDTLPNGGGVLTPASAFQNTGFVERLVERGVKIEYYSS